MNAADLMRRVLAHGADAAGIEDRFMGSDELYEACFLDFINETNVGALRRAMTKKDYARAFAAAHALKGLSGNLGLTAYYAAISALVEALRVKNPTQPDAEFARVEREYLALRALLCDEPAAPAAPPADDPAPMPAQPRHAGKRSLFLLIVAATFVLIMVFVFLLFNRLMDHYRRNVTVESADHLVEINDQLQQSIEDRVESDWMIAYTAAACFEERTLLGDEAILRMMRRIHSIWRISDLTLYTEDGGNVSAHGGVEPNDLASKRVDLARRSGEYMTVIDSAITYTVPVETTLTYRGKRIVAVSVAKDMNTFLDEMEFSAFDDAAYLYLTDNDGKVISRLTNNASAATFNVMTLFGESVETAATGERVPADALLSTELPTAFLSNHEYVVSTPIRTRRASLRIVYLVPERVVNRTLDTYSGNVTSTSYIVLAVFAACAILTIAYLNALRRKQFDSALMAREHMFDLLVRNSSTAFGLFEVNQPKPAYLSSNSFSVSGEASPALYQTTAGYEMRGADGEASPAFQRMNDALSEWDGKTAFRSGFLLNDSAEPPNYFDIQLLPINGARGEYVGIAQDVTLLYERETETRNALTLAEDASRAKTRFLSNMSHDIRTPMNAIVNMADFAIEDMDKPERLREHLKTIRESSDHLLLLINDILDMSRIESGKAVIDAAPFDLLLELKRMKDIVSPLVAAKQQTFITDFSGVQTACVLGDRVKVSQILMNLLSNAVKFTPVKGAIRFTATETPPPREHYAGMRFTVEDNGMGVSPDFLPHIFSPFTREDVKRVSGIEGTGLGLSICQNYVSAMGGSIRCESVEGSGSTFTVELFFERTNAPILTPADASAWDVTPFIGMRCLLCEDNATNQRIARTVLERLGFAVELAQNGNAGLVMFEISEPGYYDVIYMDIQMPVMDGYEAVAAIRACGHAQSDTIPIVAMSANVFIEDVEKAYIAGMDGHVGKPIATAALADETRKALHTRRKESE